jgi:hypothetical protein
MHTAIAGLFAIITGFLANFYCTIQSLTDTRLARIARTSIFLRYVSYIKIAIISGIVVSALSIPYIVFAPGPASWVSRLAIAAWFGGSTYALAAFIRIAGMIFYIFEHRPPEDEGAG